LILLLTGSRPIQSHLRVPGNKREKLLPFARHNTTDSVAINALAVVVASAITVFANAIKHHASKSRFAQILIHFSTSFERVVIEPPRLTKKAGRRTMIVVTRTWAYRLTNKPPVTHWRFFHYLGVWWGVQAQAISSPALPSDMMDGMPEPPMPIFVVIIAVLASAISTVVSCILTTLNRKPGVPYFPGDGENPNNIIFRPHQLTEAGLKARRWCLISIAVFMATILIIAPLVCWWCSPP
jgi:hypothetical protein